ncbi:hypothetical protein [uncultured Desulfobacter sp.]|uniref:hypothetical protein n=1 Tax=uncultured Desulfobacter sp. TaxID=240139 RepID=UPI002AAB39E5|nr:hypothetical protein [uncultured Desulfobacter sp.]
MPLDIDFDSIEQIFSNTWDQDWDFLFEFEVYELLAKSGSETPPRVRVIGNAPNKIRSAGQFRSYP